MGFVMEFIMEYELVMEFVIEFDGIVMEFGGLLWSLLWSLLGVVVESEFVIDEFVMGSLLWSLL